MPPSWTPPDINIIPGESCGAYWTGVLSFLALRRLENGSVVWAEYSPHLTNYLGQFRLGPGPVRDCEIEIRPAHLPRPPVRGSAGTMQTR